MRMYGCINVICSHALLRIEFTIAFRSSRAQIPTRNERAGRERNLRAAISSIKSILLALSFRSRADSRHDFDVILYFLFFFFLNLDRPIGRMRQCDMQERLRRTSLPSMLYSCGILQRKCKREDAILVTIIFYAEYVSFDNCEAEL